MIKTITLFVDKSFMFVRVFRIARLIMYSTQLV